MVRATDESKRNASSLQTKGKAKNYGRERLIAWSFFRRVRYGGENRRFLVCALEPESESALALVLLPACGSGRLGLQFLAGPSAARGGNLCRSITRARNQIKGRAVHSSSCLGAAAGRSR